MTCECKIKKASWPSKTFWCKDCMNICKQCRTTKNNEFRPCGKCYAEFVERI